MVIVRRPRRACVCDGLIFHHMIFHHMIFDQTIFDQTICDWTICEWTICEWTICDWTLFAEAIGPGTDRCHHPIPQSRHGRDVGGLPGIVAEQTTKRCHSLVDGIRRDANLRPDLREQVIDADDLACVLSQAQQESHRPRLDPSGLSLS
jgi:hypothetical protein